MSKIIVVVVVVVVCVCVCVCLCVSVCVCVCVKPTTDHHSLTPLYVLMHNVCIHGTTLACACVSLQLSVCCSIRSRVCVLVSLTPC